jgi:hypothetical protein
MLPTEHVAELRRALQALSKVVAARIEERRTTDVPLDGDEGVPQRAVFEGEGPLGTVVDACELSAEEALILVAAIAPAIDERYGALYALLAVRPGAPAALTGDVARSLAARTLAGRLGAAELLSAGAPLRSLKLLRLDPSDEGPLAGRLRADVELQAWLLGRPREVPPRSDEFPAAPLRTVHSLEDVVVPARVREELVALVARIRNRRRVAVDWGFAAHHDNVQGVVALFHGTSGTGKTLAAAVVTREAGMPGYAIDLSCLVSKYVGETSKNLARIFDVAEREDCVLVFDEADAVFGRRGEVHEARDRWAGQEVSYLLQRIETHPGVVILTTNLLANIDEAFQRRIDLTIAFPEPTLPERLLLWRSVRPPQLPVDGGVDLASLAERFELTGAEIRNATLEAAYVAAADGGLVMAEHLEAGVRRQYGKSGRMLPQRG